MTRTLTLLRPPVPIYCNGQEAMAIWRPVTQEWVCARCGSTKVRVAW